MKVEQFRDLHRRGDPLILFNIWDPDSARAVVAAGAAAVATGSWSVAASLGYDDGEAVPLDLAIDNARRIASAVDVPVTIDVEGALECARAYADAARAALSAT